MQPTRPTWRRLDPRLLAEAENTRQRGRAKPKPPPPLACPCGERHWYWPDVAAHHFPGASVSGIPPARWPCHALFLKCGPRPTVELYQSLGDARGRCRNLDRRGCGPQCRKAHKLFKLMKNGDLAPVPPQPEPVKSRFRERPARTKQQEEEE
jgi:hypothetical protein